MFEISHRHVNKKGDIRCKARVGKLHTAHGIVTTPFFMPVATKATVKYISVQDLESMGAKVIISNAFVLFLRPGHKAIEKLGGIHKFMNWKGVSFTDSGGFQMYKDVFLQKTTKDGIEFKSPFDGKKYFVTPELDMDIQTSIGSDVHMCLDSMPLIGHSKDQILDSVVKTTMWALRCKVYHEKLMRKFTRAKRQLLFGITQGGIDEELRRKSIIELKELDFDGYSVGGLALGESSGEMFRMVELQKSLIPETKPIYLMGVGSPLELIEAVYRGVDIFDSRFPTQNARRGTLFTSSGKLRIMRTEYQSDMCPIDKKCDCFVCKNYSRAYINYQLKQKEGNGYRLATYHNLYYLQRLMEKARHEIKMDRFAQFHKNFVKLYTETAETTDV